MEESTLTNFYRYQKNVLGFFVFAVVLSHEVNIHRQPSRMFFCKSSRNRYKRAMLTWSVEPSRRQDVLIDS